MVAPLNQPEREPAGTGAGTGARTDAARGAARAESGTATWLTAAAVARTTGGELLRRGRPALRIATDSRAATDGALFVCLRGQHHDGHDHAAAAAQQGARGLLVDKPLIELPGLDRSAQAPFVVRVADTGQALLQLAAEHRRRHRARVVGITGSCGKTTCKEWLGSVLAAAMPTVRSPGSYNNRIGVPLTLFAIDPSTRAAVVEIGTNAPGEIAELSAVAQPEIGLVTCVAAAHLTGLGSRDGVAREKSALPQSLPAHGLCILNGDDIACRAMAESTAARVQFVAIDRPAHWFATEVRFHGLGTTFLLQGERPVTLPRLGTHNVYNALMVIAAAGELGVPEDLVLDVLARIPAASRRLESKDAAGVLLFDDTYNMNPLSARAGLQALAGLPGRGQRIAVLGGMLELGAESDHLHRELGAAVAAMGLDLLLCVGGGAVPIAEGARAAGMAPDRVLPLADQDRALAVLLERCQAGDRVLCKASRGVALDRLVDRFIAARQAAPAPGPARTAGEGR